MHDANKYADSKEVSRGPCPKCGSSNNLVLFDDGHSHCFGASCDYWEPGDGNVVTLTQPKTSLNLVQGEYQALGKRGITEDICKRYGYQVGKINGKTVHIANYRKDGGQIVGQKIRTPDKQFSIRGSLREAGFFGQHLFGQGGKMVTVVEGEIDCLSMAQVMGNGKWPVVSIPNGAQSAAKIFAQQSEWLETFEKVVIAFDMDEAGQSSAKEAAEKLAPGKAYIASLPAKDANEAMLAGKGKELVDSIWQAKAYRPDGILNAKDLWTEVSKVQLHEAVDYPWPKLNEMTHGLRKGEMVCFTSGSGMGKSSVIREIMYDLLINKSMTVGALMLEESTTRTAKGIMGLDLNAPIHIPDYQVGDEDLREAFDATCGTGRLFLYDHWGSQDIDALIAKIRYLAVSCECDYIILDHVSIVVSGLGEGDERRLIDNLATKLRSLTENTGVGLIVISHLKRPEGTPHEEGAQTRLGQLRGSAGLGQVCDMVIGLERNQQNEETKHLTTIRVLKNRFSGDCGVAGQLQYDKTTGRLSAASEANDPYSNPNSQNSAWPDDHNDF